MKMLKIKAWLDSGANIHSCREVTFEVDECDWLAMDEFEQDAYAQDYAWNRMDWGYEIVGDDNL